MNPLDDFKDIKRKFKKNLIALNNELEQIEEMDDLKQLESKVTKAKNIRIESEN